MSDAEIREIQRAHDRMMEWFRSLSPQEKVARLKTAGILDETGNLTVRYGGEGEAAGVQAESRSSG